MKMVLYLTFKRGEKMLECYKYRGACHFRRAMLNNRRDLKIAEINFKIAKQNLMMKIDWCKENKFYVNLFSMSEYIYYLGCKEVLKKVHKKRKQIKYCEKNLNKIKNLIKEGKVQNE